ncbi:hypothetical protein LZ32DRAFT_597945, partial [Colletotrichum eremochloae]
MDHSHMDHSKMDHSAMDHGNMGGHGMGGGMGDRCSMNVSSTRTHTRVSLSPPPTPTELRGLPLQEAARPVPPPLRPASPNLTNT